jgi:membrane protein DedA with SNARE-associated domain
MALADELLGLVEHNHNVLGLGLLALSACIEYVFPPFPGDTVVVFGAFLVARRGWSATAVMGVVLLGSAVGCMVDYGAGRWLARSETRWTSGWLSRARPRIDVLVARFERHGALYIIVNRFLPSLRALFFVAAGMARLPAWKVLACGLISALLWNTLLLGVGVSVGREWPELRRLLEAYGTAAWTVILVAAALLTARWAYRRRHASGR